MEKKREKEKILLLLKQSRRAFLWEYLGGLFLLVLLVIYYLKKGGVNETAAYLITGLALVSIGSAELSRLVHQCRITPSKLVIVDGLIKRSKKHIYIEAISDIDVKQGLVQRLLNYGTIHIKSMSGDASLLEIKEVANPTGKMEEIEKIIEKYKKR